MSVPGSLQLFGITLLAYRRVAGDVAVHLTSIRRTDSLTGINSPTNPALLPVEAVPCLLTNRAWQPCMKIDDGFWK
jgi:hypothetical protein